MDIALAPRARSLEDAQHAGFVTGLVLIAFAGLTALALPMALLFRIVPRTYNEGWNAFWADAAVQGTDLYTSVDSFITNNYPPLSFHVLGALGEILDDNVIAGRLVSLASFAIVIFAAYLWLRAAGSARHIAAAGAVVLFTTFVIYGQDYVAMNDPQLLAHALMLSALVVLWRLDFSRLAIVIAASLILLGGFTKHLLIPLPAALTLWIALYRRERLHLWLACLGVGVPLGFWLTSNSYPSFVDSLLLPREYDMHQAISAARHAVVRLLPLLVLGAIPVVSAMRSTSPGERMLSPRNVFALMFASFALVIGAVAGGGVGVTRNAFFDLIIASALCAALGLEWLWKTGVGPASCDCQRLRQQSRFAESP